MTKHNLESILISTTGGNTLLRPEAWVHVHLGEDKYIRMQARNVKPGQEVLYANEGIDIGWDEVHKVLMERSPRYAIAYDELFVSDKSGRTTTRFRKELIKALGILPADLDHRLFLDEGGITDEEYAKMTGKLKDTIAMTDTAMPGDTTIWRWLRGKTVAARNPDIYDILSELDPVFRSYKDGPLREHWSTYLALKTHLTRYFRNKGPHEPTDGKGASRGRDIRPEVQMIMDAIIRPMDTHHSIVTVTAAREASIPEGGSTKEGPGKMLSQGVVMGYHLEGIEINYITFQELVSHVRIVEGAIEFLAYEYIKRSPDNPISRYLEGSMPGLREGDIMNPAGILVYGILKAHGSNSPGVKELLSDLESIAERSIMDASRQTAVQLTDGSFDKVVGLAPGTSSKAFHAYSRARETLPDLFWEYETQRISAEEVKGIDRKGLRKLERVKSKLKKRFGIDMAKPGIYLSEFLRANPTLYNQPGARMPHTYLAMDRELMRQGARDIRNRSRILQRKMVEDVLALYGLGDLMAYIPKNEFI